MKHLHSGASCVQKKLANVLGNKSKVLCNYLCLWEGLGNLCKECNTGSLIPLTVSCGRIAIRNIIISRESTEMVDSKNIVKRESKTNTVYPPRKSVLLHKLPIVYRVAPKLTVGREAVGRTSRNDRRIKAFVKQELLGRRPNVHTIMRNVDRHIADKHYSLFMSVAKYILPFCGKLILNPTPEGHLVLKRRLILNCLLIITMLLCPSSPLSEIVVHLKSHKERVILEPLGILLYKGTVSLVGRKTRVRQSKNRISYVKESAVIYFFGIVLLYFYLVIIKKSLFGKYVEIYKIRVTRYR